MHTPESIPLDYLSQRQKRHRTTVELGHGYTPIGLRHPEDYQGDRAYIGIEQWLRAPSIASHSDAWERKQSYPNSHIFFIAQQASGSVERSQDQRSEEWYQGDYSTTTLLPDHSVEEVVASNVITDPLVAQDETKLTALLTEMRRIKNPEDVIVLRETITPRNTWYLEHAIGACGLQRVCRLNLNSVSTWCELEQVFNGEPGLSSPHPNSFYDFLR